MRSRLAALVVLASCSALTGCAFLPRSGPKLHAVVVPAAPAGTQVPDETLQAAARVLQVRLQEVHAQVKAEPGRILVSLPSGDASLLQESLQPGDLRFLLMPTSLENAPSPPALVYWVDKTTRKHVPDAEAIAAGKVILHGSDFLPNALAEEGDRGPKVYFELRGDRQADFRAWSAQHVGRFLAIVLDDKFLESPMIKDALPGKGIIEGGLSMDEARHLVRCINSGPLPVPLAIQEQTGPASPAQPPS